MASCQIRLVIEAGDLDSGFSVSLQCFDSRLRTTLVARGQLPAQPDLRFKYRDWKKNYLQWGGSSRLDPIADKPANISFVEQLQASATALDCAMNDWLESETFRPLLQTLYRELSPIELTTLIVQTQYLELFRLPWSRWRLLDAFPHIALVFARDEFRMPPSQALMEASPQVRILAVLAADGSVDTAGDRLALEQLPRAALTVLSNPTRQQITDQLWSSSWDIFCFAGHSSSQSGQGKFTIASEQWIQPSDLKFGLQRAAQNGLKLAIFNSCDGLAIAQALVQTDIPFIITMREPVPDAVAQLFLNYFLRTYSQGQSLYQAFQQANQRLESIEDHYPCATWLPVLMCNPTVAPPEWRDFTPQSSSTSKESLSRLPRRRQRSRLLFCLGMMLFLLLIRSAGLLQSLELWSLDRMLQLRPQELPDSRILVVEVDEAMLQSQRSDQGSISDQHLHQAIEILRQHQPRVIGLDIYRDHPDMAPSLAATFQQSPEVIGVCKSPELEHDDLGVASPQGLPVSRLGFSDLLEDRDGVVRRQLLFMGLAPTKTCPTSWSFSSQLALQYLKHEQIHPQFSKHPHDVDKHLILGERDFYPIRHAWGGYQDINLGGNQILLNYRALPHLRDIAPTVRLTDVLMNRVPDTQIRDRLIMIGVTANTTADFWETPHQSATDHRIPGVFLQAHMTSQVISAVLDQRPLIRALPRWGDLLLLLMMGSLGVMWPVDQAWKKGLCGLMMLGIVALSYGALIYGWWLPVVPAVLTFLGMSVMYHCTVRGWSPQNRTQR